VAFRRRWPQRETCFVGIWLLFAALIFWALDAAAAANNGILVGTLAIAFSILAPIQAC
jgi:hypothetical protein